MFDKMKKINERFENGDFGSYTEVDIKSFNEITTSLAKEDAFKFDASIVRIGMDKTRNKPLIVFYENIKDEDSDDFIEFLKYSINKIYLQSHLDRNSNLSSSSGSNLNQMFALQDEMRVNENFSFENGLDLTIRINGEDTASIPDLSKLNINDLKIIGQFNTGEIKNEQKEFKFPEWFRKINPKSIDIESLNFKLLPDYFEGYSRLKALNIELTGLEENPTWVRDRIKEQVENSNTKTSDYCLIDNKADELSERSF